MNHREIKQLHKNLIALIDHCVLKEVDIYHVNYGLDRNLTKLQAAVEAINKNISQELKDSEAKVWELVRSAKKEDEGAPVFDTSLLSKKEKQQHEDLFVKYLEFMEEPNDFEPYLLNPEKIDGVRVEFLFYQILKQFLPKE